MTKENWHAFFLNQIYSSIASFKASASLFFFFFESLLLLAAYPVYASVNSSSAHPPPPGISGAFFLIVHHGGRALVYPGAFDSFVIFTSQHCHFLSVISSSGKDDKFVINFV